VAGPEIQSVRVAGPEIQSVRVAGPEIQSVRVARPEIQSVRGAKPEVVVTDRRTIRTQEAQDRARFGSLPHATVPGTRRTWKFKHLFNLLMLWRDWSVRK
jgi:hypothetical protein